MNRSIPHRVFSRRTLAGLSVVLLTAGVAPAEVTKDASVDQILSALNDRGQDLKSLAADVTLGQSDDLGAETERRGTMALQRGADGDTRIHILFTERKSGDQVEKVRHEFLLDGPTLVERDYRQKKQTTRIVRKPGEKFDVFKLGEGPMPLPIGQAPAEVKKEFDVTKAAPEGAAGDLTWIKLTPKPGTGTADKFKYVFIGVRPDGWPVRVEASDPNETELTRATLNNIRINADVRPEEFKLPPIDDSWDKIDATR